VVSGGTAMMPREASLSDSWTPGRCSSPSLGSHHCTQRNGHHKLYNKLYIFYILCIVYTNCINVIQFVNNFPHYLEWNDETIDYFRNQFCTFFFRYWKPINCFNIQQISISLCAIDSERGLESGAPKPEDPITEITSTDTYINGIYDTYISMVYSA